MNLSQGYPKMVRERTKLGPGRGIIDRTKALDALSYDAYEARLYPGMLAIRLRSDDALAQRYRCVYEHIDTIAPENSYRYHVFVVLFRRFP